MADILCCLQFFFFTNLFMDERFRENMNFQTGIALLLLLCADLYALVICCYVCRRCHKPICVSHYGPSITQHLPPLAVAGLFISGTFVAVWTTWRLDIKLLCANSVCIFCGLYKQFSGTN